MEKLEKILRTRIRKLGLDTRIKEKTIFLYWEDIVGKLSRFSTPAFVNQGVLFVNVPNSVWAHNMLIFKHEILNRINSRLGSKIIKDIRFKCGKVGVRRFKGFDGETGKKIESIDLTEKELAKVDAIAFHIKDEVLRERFKEIVVKDLKYRKWKLQQKWKPCVECKRLHDEKHQLCYYCRSINNNNSVI